MTEKERIEKRMHELDVLRGRWGDWTIVWKGLESVFTLIGFSGCFGSTAISRFHYLYSGLRDFWLELEFPANAVIDQETFILQPVSIMELNREGIVAGQELSEQQRGNKYDLLEGVGGSEPKVIIKGELR